MYGRCALKNQMRVNWFRICNMCVCQVHVLSTFSFSLVIELKCLMWLNWCWGKEDCYSNDLCLFMIFRYHAVLFQLRQKAKYCLLWFLWCLFHQLNYNVVSGSFTDFFFQERMFILFTIHVSILYSHKRYTKSKILQFLLLLLTVTSNTNVNILCVRRTKLH